MDGEIHGRFVSACALLGYFTVKETKEKEAPVVRPATLYATGEVEAAAAANLELHPLANATLKSIQQPSKFSPVKGGLEVKLHGGAYKPVGHCKGLWLNELKAWCTCALVDFDPNSVSHIRLLF